jgi:hypothetical protein
MVTVNKKCKICVTDRNVQTGTNTQTLVSSLAVTNTCPLPIRDSTCEAQQRVQRKQFRPNDAQRTILEQDNANGTTTEINRQRASEFGVDISQIHSWHRRFKQKQQQKT